MRTSSIDVVKSKPGIWLVIGRGATILMEVLPDGACHQLNPDTFERDGELVMGGWRVEAIVTLVGPLQRVGLSG